MKDLQADLLHYQTLAKAQGVEIARLKNQVERYRAALNLSSGQEEKRLREEVESLTRQVNALFTELRSVKPHSDDYLHFVLKLGIATQFDQVNYANWVRDNAVQLSIGFDKSDETDMCVYGRMQYTRSRGFGV